MEPDWLVPLLQKHKGAISIQFGSHQNCMECVVMLEKEATATCHQKNDHTTTQSLPSFQLQALATAQQAQVTKQTFLDGTTTRPTKKTKLLLWKSLFDQIAGCLAASGVHPAYDNNTNIYANSNANTNTKQQEIALELFLKQNKNQMTDPSPERTVLLNRRQRASSGHPSCSFSSSWTRKKKLLRNDCFP